VKPGSAPPTLSGSLGATLALSSLAWLAAAVAILALGSVALGAEPSPMLPSPSPLPPELLEGGDLRSDGAGPGLVGSPLLILAAVIVLGLATAGATVVIARLTQRD
jgi:hypothetical protein